MFVSPTRAPSALLVVIVAVALLPLAGALPSAAAAGTPATVTVRIQGLGGETLLPQTQVTTNTTPIAVEGGGTCEGTSAGGAIYDATGGQWKAKNQPEGIELQGLEGLDLPEFNSKEPPGIYWAFWLENKYAEQGICSQSIVSGQHIVLFPQCYAVGPLCQSETAPANFLTAEPAEATANIGQGVSVKLGALSTATALPDSSLPEGDLLTDGAQTFAPAADGIAIVSFSGPGLYTLQAHAPDSVASDSFTICVHNGNDGTCGTSIPSGGEASKTSTTAQTTSPATGIDLAKIEGVKSAHIYSHRSAPRLLAGVVSVPAGGTLHQVRISLKRSYRGRCFDFNGSREEFVRIKCGKTAQFFSVGDTESFSYLLPARLPAGTYTYDIEAVNDAGQTTKLVSGVSHVVFRVK
jgi:hypothetical protein